MYERRYTLRPREQVTFYLAIISCLLLLLVIWQKYWIGSKSDLLVVWSLFLFFFLATIAYGVEFFRELVISPTYIREHNKITGRSKVMNCSSIAGLFHDATRGLYVVTATNGDLIFISKSYANLNHLLQDLEACTNLSFQILELPEKEKMNQTEKPNHL